MTRTLLLLLLGFALGYLWHEHQHAEAERRHEARRIERQRRDNATLHSMDVAEQVVASLWGDDDA